MPKDRSLEQVALEQLLEQLVSRLELQEQRHIRCKQLCSRCHKHC
jgi:hypothetical protein